MRNIVELRQKRAKAVAAARAVLTQAEKREDWNGTLSSEEQQQYDRAFGEAQNLKTEIERQEQLLEEERTLAASASGEGGPPRPDPGSGSPDDERRTEPLTPYGRPEYRAAFGRWLRYGERGLRPEEQRAIQVDDDVKAGYLVASEQFSQELIKFIDDMVWIRGLATTQTLTTAKSLGVPSLDTDVEDFDWTGEITAVDEDTALAFGKRTFEPRNLSKLVKVSRDLLRYGTAGAERIVRERLGYKFALTHEKAFLTGSGSGQPLGLFTASASGISTSRDVSTDNTTTAITVDNLKRNKYNLKEPYRSRARWLFHRDAISALSRLKYADGKYIWAESARVGEPDRLLNVPVMESEHVPNTFTTGLYVGMIADFSFYWIVDVLDMEIQRLEELYAATSQVGFIGRGKTDGMPVLEEAFSRVTLA